MLALYLVPLLAASMFFVVLDGQGDDETLDTSDPVEPETDDPEADDIVAGTEGADEIEAVGAETVNAGEGDDTLTATSDSDGAVLNGEGGADVLTLQGANGTANGGVGQDTLEALDQVNPLLNGGDGDDTIRIDGPLTETDTAGTASGGGGEDTITANGVGVTVLGGAGNDLINTQGSMDNVSGGTGDDTIIADTADYGGATTVNGDDGDDRISLLESAGFGTVQQADGGAGDDVIDSEYFGGGAIDILTGGAGADVFEVTFNSTGPGDYGTLVEITDFNTAEDALVVDLQFTDGFAADDADSSIEVAEAADGSYTDVVFTITATGTSGPLTASFRLDGVTGLDPADINFTTSTALAS